MPCHVQRAAGRRSDFEIVLAAVDPVLHPLADRHLLYHDQPVHTTLTVCPVYPVSSLHSMIRKKLQSYNDFIY